MGTFPLTAPIAVLGSGSWGTALAIQFARAGKPTRLWGRDAAQRAAMREARVNQRYLPDAAFPELLQVADSIEAALQGVGDVVIAVPSNAFRTLLAELAPRITSDVRVAWATKGFRAQHRAAAEPGRARGCWAMATRLAVLSGPTFAREVGPRPAYRHGGGPHPMRTLQCASPRTLASPGFRTYVSTDITGVEIGGAVKNVIAVGAGAFRRPGFRRQHARGADHARPRRDDKTRRRAGRARAHLHGPRRPR